ncbi:related to mitochondrial hypoxia responsive domain [Lecanosticta acicola]|uniref:Related to mitochondrial hypoxia responsive domain n=1 Tax=Lecanosticta acicola TaxID=111012 RepID=A0AAI9E823_9PEZI|nr:related to mitochondrial hypoxia responsive domain [Lecanosticta acicola]
MKILTPEEQQEHYNATVKGGTLGGLIGTAAGTLGVYAATMRYPAFRSLSLPFRAFLATSSGTFTAIIAADRYSRYYEASRHPEKNYKDEQETLQEQLASQKSTKERVIGWLQENRYSIVFGSWVASMSAAMGIVGRNPYLTTQQKLVQARVYAQGFTLAAVICSLAFETGDSLSNTGRWETVKVIDPSDPTHKHIIEKKIHHERYAGEDQWMDMVAAEEQRMKEREEAVRQREAAEKKNGKPKKAKHESETKGNPEEGDKKVLAP